MARKKKRRGRSKKSNPTKKRSHKRKKHRRSVAANPRRRRRSHKRRSNPSRRRHRRSHARRRSNPGGFRRKHRRHTRRRRNPGGPYGEAAIAVAAGAAAFVGVNALTYYATSDMAKDGQRNAKIIAGLVTAAGLYLAVAKQKVALGIALAAGGLLGGFGNFLILKLMQHLPAKQIAAAPKQGAVFAQDMAGYEQLGAVAYDNLSGYEQLGAVAYDNMNGMGDPVPPAPWESNNPF